MIKTKKILVIIPARGNSKGIPRKNIRLMVGKPLIHYSINNCLKSKYIDKVVVSTDCDEIAYIAGRTGVEVFKRPAELAEDNIPLDPVIYHAVDFFEKENNESFDIIITVQATSPLLSTDTIDKAIEKFIEKKVDTMLSVIDDRHLSWIKKEDEYFPDYEKRLNRQFLPMKYRETGGFLISKRECVTKETRFGKKIDLIEVPKSESIDIDNEMDWWIAEKVLARKKIIFRVDGYKEIGLGHIYRTLVLAYRMIDHDLLFVTSSKYKLGLKKLQESNFKVKSINDQDEFHNIIDEYSPDIIINDLLDTSEDYVIKLKEKNIFVVNFEDLGSGIKEADLVINSLYEEKYDHKNCYWGKDYYCLKDDFLIDSYKSIKKEVSKILITFGGTDPNNYTLKILKLFEKYKLNLNRVEIILGMGYLDIENLNKYLEKTSLNVKFYKNVKSMAKHMLDSDVIITSAGRTVFEGASLGIPMIVLAQNNRELKHTFAREENGIVNLGKAFDLKEFDLISKIKGFIEDYDLRLKNHTIMLEKNLKNGTDNVLKLIFEKYESRKKR